MMEKATSVPTAVSPDSGLYDYGPSVQSTPCTEQPMVHNFTAEQQVMGALAAFGITIALAVVLSVVWVRVANRR